MTAAAGPWHGTAGPATVCRAASREEAMRLVDGSRLEGIRFVTNTQTGVRWIRDPETKAWRPFVPVARSVKERRQQREPAGGYWWQEKD